MMQVQVQTASQVHSAAGGKQHFRQASGAGEGGTFFAQLAAILNGQPGKGTSTVYAGYGWPLLFPVLTAESGAESRISDVSQFQKTLEMLLELLQQGDMGTGSGPWGTLWQLPEVQEWLIQAERALALGSGNPFSQDGAFSGMPAGQQGALTLSSHRAQRILVELLQAVHRHPQSPQWQPLMQSFFRVFHPILERLPGGGLTAKENSDLTAALPVEGLTPPLADAEGKRMGQPGVQSDKGTLSFASNNGNSGENGLALVWVHGKNRMMKTETALQTGAAEKASIHSASADLAAAKELYAPAEGKNEAPFLPAQVVDARTLPKEWLAKPGTVHIPVHHFARDLGEMIMKNFSILLKNGISEAKLSLVPEHLGSVDIRISVQNGQVIAQFFTETMLAKDALEGQIAQLRTALQNQGLQVEKIEVSQQSPLSSAPFGEHQHGQPSRQYYANQRKAAHYEEWQDDFSLDPEYFDVSAGYPISGTIDISA